MTAAVIRGPWPPREPTETDKARTRAGRKRHTDRWSRIGYQAGIDPTGAGVAWVAMLLVRSAQRNREPADISWLPEARAEISVAAGRHDIERAAELRELRGLIDALRRTRPPEPPAA